MPVGILGISSVVSAGTSILFAVILFFLAPVLAASSFNAPELSGVLRLSSIAVFFISMNAFQTGSLLGLQAFRVTAIANFIQGGISLLTILLLVPRFGLNGAVGALILTSGSVWLWTQRLLRAECGRYRIRITHRGIWLERRIFFEFALPAALSGITTQIAVWGGSAILARQANGMAELALFSVSNTFRMMVLFAPSIVTRVAMPLLANLTGHTTSRSYRSSFNLNVRINALLGVGAACVLSLVAPFILPAYGKGFAGALTTTFALVAAAALECISTAFFQALVGHGKIWWQYAFVTVWSASLVLGAFLLGPRLGALGLGLAYLAGGLFSVFAYSVAAKVLNDRAEVRGNATGGPVSLAASRVS